MVGVSSFTQSSSDLADDSNEGRSSGFIAFRDELAKDIGLDVTWGDQPYQVKGIKVGEVSLRPVQDTEEMQKFFVALFGDAEVVKHYATGKPY